jgi:F-type H+-transporting ATPase subunit epsilon
VTQEGSPLLHLEVVAPAGPVFAADVQEVVLPAITGEMGVLPRHAPLVAQLSIGRMRVKTEGGHWVDFAVAEGFAKVQANQVVVLADAAEEASKIDVPRVQKSMERATQRLEMLRLGAVPEGEDVDPYREQLALKRAQNRLRVAERREE